MLAVSVLAVGMGAHAAIFAIMNGLLLKPLAFDPGRRRLAAVWLTVLDDIPHEMVGVMSSDFVFDPRQTVMWVQMIESARRTPFASISCRKMRQIQFI